MSIKIACAQIELFSGRPDINTKKILETMATAYKNNINILLFPELAIPGYFLGDLWEQNDFLSDCQSLGEEIIEATKKYNDLCVIFGNIAIEPEKLNEDGRLRKYNAAFVAQNGKLLSSQNSIHPFITKTALPNYRFFDDSRHFTSFKQVALENNLPAKELYNPINISFGNESIKIGLLICEDGWSENYFLNIPKILVENGAEVLFNISCSPFSLKKNNKRNNIFSSTCLQNKVPLFYCNNIGMQNNGKNIFSFDGCSAIYNSKGILLSEAPAFSEYVLSSFQNSEIVPNNRLIYNNQTTKIEATYLSIRYALEKFLKQTKITKMTIGLSGGIDSAVAAALFVDVLGPQNVLLINMPSEYNSPLTQNLANTIAKNLKTNYSSIPITQSCEYTKKQLSKSTIHNYQNDTTGKLTITPFLYENIQSRDRGARILAGMAAAFGGGFSCNSNKTELTVGYATFYGDICGAVAPLGDLWKHEVYELGKYINASVFHKNVLPNELFTIRPSAELSPSQTVGLGGDPLTYPYHDYLFKALTEHWHRISPSDILKWYQNGTLSENLGCDPDIINNTFTSVQEFVDDLEHWWVLMNTLAVAKRIQAPPIISISKRAYGYDNRESQLSPYFSKKYNFLKQQLLT